VATISAQVYRTVPALSTKIIECEMSRKIVARVQASKCGQHSVQRQFTIVKTGTCNAGVGKELY
jgi:hypothetical protein